MLIAEKVHKGFELAGLLAEVAGGADEAGEFCLRHLFHGGGCEQIRLAQIGDGSGGVHPVGVLDQDGADDHFERRAARPPVLLAVSLKQRIEILRENGQARRSQCGARLTGPAGLAERCRCTGRRRQSVARRHLIRTISMGCRQVKNARGRGRRTLRLRSGQEAAPTRLPWVVTKATLSFDSVPCSTVQVLANSQRGFKIGRRRHRLFAMFGDRCTSSRERCGCLSV